MKFLIKFHKNSVSTCCTYLCVMGGGCNPVFIDEETEDLRNKCFLQNLFESPKGKANTKINRISFSFFLSFLRLHSRHVEVPRLGVQLEL